MLTSFSMTLPTIADKYRTLGRQYINTPLSVSHPNLLLGRTDADNTHHYWHKQSIKNVYDGLQANKTSNRHYLSDRFKPVRGTNATNTPFGSSNAPQNVVAGRGGANITQSSSMSDKDYDDWRKFVVNQRAEGYTAIRSSQPPPQSVPPKMQSIMGDPNKAIENQLDLLLTSIEERIFGGIIDNNVFKDLMDFTRGIEGIIYSFDDAQEITDLINRFKSLFTAIEGIASRRGTIGSTAKESNLAESSLALINRLIKFLKENMTGIGRNESTRQLLQRGTREILTQVGNPQRTQIKGQLTEGEIMERLESGDWSKDVINSSPIDDLENIGRNVGYINTKDYKTATGKRKAFITGIAEKLLGDYGIDLDEY
jgi:hypothetical protein